MNSFYESVRKLHKQNYDIRYSINILTDYDKKILYDEMKDSRFSTPTVCDYILSCNNKEIYSTDNITINVISKQEDQPNMLFMKRITKRLEILHRMFQINRHIKYWIICDKFHRVMPKAGDNICNININGGFTYQNGSEIYIYRNQGFPKVLVHELLHHSSLDTYNEWNNINNKKYLEVIKKNFNVCNNTIVRPNEGVVEYWAVKFHNMFLSLEYPLEYKFIDEVEKENIFRLTNRLLKHYKDREWSETTNSLCYIVLRSLMIWNYRVFEKLDDIEKVTKYFIDTWNDKKYQKYLRTRPTNFNDIHMAVFENL